MRLSSQYHQILHCLAVRNYNTMGSAILNNTTYSLENFSKEKESWFDMPSVNEFICLVCGKKHTDIDTIYEHGFHHLKEYNLLPFV